MTPLLVLEDSVITQLLRNQELVTAFPFMSNLASRVAPQTSKPRCKPCAAKRVQNGFDYNGIKVAIGSLANDQKVKFKKMVDAEKVRLYFVNSKKQKVKMTF
jgi:hypothetical protein